VDVCLSEERVEQRIALGALQPDEVTGEHRVHVERLATGFGVRAHDGMLDGRVLKFLTPLLGRGDEEGARADGWTLRAERNWDPALLRGGKALTTVGRMTSDTATSLNERRVFGGVSAWAAAVVGVMSIIDLDQVDVRDVVVIAATVGSYLVYGAVARFPAWAPFVIACVAVTVLNLPGLRTEGAMFFVVLALAHLALNESHRRVVLVCGLVAVAVPGIVAVSGGRDWSWQYWMMGFGFGWGFGELGYRFRLARDELAKTRALVADQAALEERQRVARDVHDVLGHSITIVMLQLTAARHLLRSDPDEADAALADAERVGRDSLDQVRRTVGLLRADEPVEPRDGTGPSPTLEDLEYLLADYRSAGVLVRADVVGPIATLDTSRSVAGYRIVQEAMANVSKHAPAAETRVSVQVDGPGGTCRIVVDSKGGGQRSRGSSGGFGLVGMRERARSVGGSVDAGPVAHGWRVSAALPALSENAGAGA
jgi:signal transduction histidine kinase